MPISNLSIIVPVYGKPQMVYDCLKGVARENVTVIDDCGPQSREIARICSKFEVPYEKNPVNLGFLKTVNKAVSQTDTEYVFLLNSDCIVPKGQLGHMLYAAKTLNAEITGCRLVFPQTGRIQHAGVAAAYNGLPYHPFMYLYPETPHVTRVMFVNAVTGAALLIKRDAWDRLGGLDEAFGLGVYEDVDLCWRARRMGMTVLYDGYAMMYHYMHGSKHPNGYHHDVSGPNLKLLNERHRMESDEHLFYGACESQFDEDGKWKS